jgi:hypothetical protein
LKSHLNRHELKRSSESFDSHSSNSQQSEGQDIYNLMNDNRAAATLLSFCQTSNQVVPEAGSPNSCSTMSPNSYSPIHLQMVDGFAPAPAPLHQMVKVDENQPMNEVATSLVQLSNVGRSPPLQAVHSCCSNENIIRQSQMESGICKCEPGMCQRDGKGCCAGCPGDAMGVCGPEMHGQDPVMAVDNKHRFENIAPNAMDATPHHEHCP